VNVTVEMIRRPLVATEAKRNVVIPPSTAEGMATRAAANLLKTPMIMSQKQAAYPAFLLAHRVKASFCQLYTYFTSSRGLKTNNSIVLTKDRHRSNDIVSISVFKKEMEGVYRKAESRRGEKKR
jgi:hypothetical protein